MIALLPALVALGLPLAPPPLRGVEPRIAAGGELVLVVTAPARTAWRALNGARWSVDCQAFPPPFGDEPGRRSLHAAGVVVGLRSTVHSGLHPLRARMDACFATITTDQASQLVATRALSAAGRVTLDVDAALTQALGAATFLQQAFARNGRLPPASAVPRAVGLSSPAAPAPASERVGIYSDPSGHAVAAVRTPAGRSVRTAFDAPDVLSVNLPGAIDVPAATIRPLVPVSAMSAGVTARVDAAAVTFQLPPALARALPGGLDVSCEQVLPSGRRQTSGQVDVSAGGVARLSVQDPATVLDGCVLRRVKREAGATSSGEVVARVPLSDAGRAAFERAQASATTIGALQDAARLATGGARYAGADRLAAVAPGPVVPLAAPGLAPPPGTVGFFSDGTSRAYAATLASDGRVLFAERDGQWLRSNVLLDVT